jgi:2-dehydropantoate 2-reductase
MKQIKTVAIIGAGALGIMYGQRLASALGHSCVFFAADTARVTRYKSEGLFCNGQRCHVSFIDTSLPAPSVDLIIFAVKFTAMDAAIQAAQAICHDETIFVSVLNGIESEDVIARAFGADHLLHCEVHGMDATKTGNHVHYSRLGAVVFGRRDPLSAEDADMAAFSALLESAAIPYEISSDIMHALWSKLMLNAGVNQVTAVFETDYGGIQSPGPARDLMIATMQEVQHIASYEGILLSNDEIKTWLHVLDTLNPRGLPSLRQDTMAGRKTEVALFSGTICALGKKHGVPTPCNDKLYHAIRKLEDQ